MFMYLTPEPGYTIVLIFTTAIMLINVDNVLPRDFSCKGLLSASYSSLNPEDIEARRLAHEEKHMSISISLFPHDFPQADGMQYLADLPPRIINDPKMHMTSYDMLYKIGEDAAAYFTKQ